MTKKSATGSYDPNKQSIGQLLSVTSPKIVVPRWQRSYSWKLENIETFWTDLISFMKSTKRSEYFLGSVVIVRTSAGEHLLLDGQQRLATATILLSAIRDRIRDYKQDAAQRIQARYLADFDDASETTTYKLTLNAYDGEFFRRYILENRSNEGWTSPEIERASHQLIAKAREFFVSQLNASYEALEPKAAFKWALEVQKALTDHLTMIAIFSTDEDSAAEVFETLNDRGIGLSTPDLLRNLLMRRAHEKNHELLVDLWDPVLSFDKDQLIKNFIRHFWISKYGDVKSQALYREIRDHIIEEDISSVEFSSLLRDAAEVYRSILDAISKNPDCEKLLSDVQNLGAGARILYPSLLAAIEILTLPNQANVFRSLIKTYVRHSVIGQRENSKLENVLYKATRELRTHKDADQFIKSIEAASLTDADFEKAFEQAIVTDTRVQRYLLTALEGRLRTTEELDVAPPSRVHVEHIYPQTPEQSQKWESHSSFINRLGNLTLLSAKLNKEIQNSGFGIKKPKLMASNLVITQKLSEYETWTPDSVITRQKWMAKMATEIW